jgi:peptidyl-tRNA hydrolase, PTH1 family
MKRFVFGLGNPGEKYTKTRHNVGFMVLEQLVQSLADQDFCQVGREQQKFYAKLYRICDTFLVEPQTFMNDSGRAAHAVIEYFDKDLLTSLKSEGSAGTLEKPTVVVIYDDLDIPLGEWKMQFGKGPKVHNGLNSIRQHLHSDKFLHVRVGIDGRQGSRTQSGSDYVLTGFHPEEKDTVHQAIQAICDELRRRLQ